MPKLSAVAASLALLNTQVLAQSYGIYSGISNVSSTACPTGDGVHVIVARASLEPEGYGIIGYVKDQVLAAIPGSNADFVVYPATLNNYLQSETDGVVAMRDLITNFSANCPSSLIVAMGYSQGAQVTGDSLVGQDDNGFPDNSTVDQPLSSTILSKVAAVILMGDPTLLVNQTFHVGNSTKNSDFPRHNTANFNIAGLANRTQSYCDAGDPYCAAGSDLAVHLGYVQEYGAQAVKFVVAQVQKLEGGSISGTNGTTGTNATSTASATATATTTAKPSPTGSPSGTPAPYQGAAVIARVPYVLGGALLAGLWALTL